MFAKSPAFNHRIPDLVGVFLSFVPGVASSEKSGSPVLA